MNRGRSFRNHALVRDGWVCQQTHALCGVCCTWDWRLSTLLYTVGGKKWSSLSTRFFSPQCRFQYHNYNSSICIWTPFGRARRCHCFPAHARAHTHRHTNHILVVHLHMIQKRDGKVIFPSVVCFLLGNFPASEFYTPTFRNTICAIFIGG